MALKRIFDVVAAGAGLVVSAPIMVAAAIAIRAETSGPVIFRQERVGLNAVPFQIHKFRTLRTSVSGLMISPSHDPRITRVGRVLRRTKVDELPQLFDVLIGRMSMVGPRPEVPHYVALWPDEARSAILSVRPGITDRASIALRDEAHELGQALDPEQHYVSSLLPRKVAMYVTYVQTRSFVGDLAILAETLAAVSGWPRRSAAGSMPTV